MKKGSNSFARNLGLATAFVSLPYIGAMAIGHYIQTDFVKDNKVEYRISRVNHETTITPFISPPSRSLVDANGDGIVDYAFTTKFDNSTYKFTEGPHSRPSSNDQINFSRILSKVKK